MIVDILLRCRDCNDVAVTPGWSAEATFVVNAYGYGGEDEGGYVGRGVSYPLPEGWRPRYGDDGRGHDHVCPRCAGVK